ncbi:DUF6653 family protein [Falsiroseomonas sp.]|uniref:DUF6653 family protein n=1 Tax=Falsiroseomonas sp. TaxID=2870721 RepID=UPI003F6F6E88
MTLEARIARAHRMDDAAWARHANPWSVWTRIPILPALALVAWARVWIGWGALLPVALLLAWTWANPRAFAPPANTDNWASRAVLGERLWLARRDHPVPAHHRTLPVVLNAMAALGGLALGWGLVVLDGVLALAGLAVAIGAKMWFLDRMVWLTHAMRDDPRLRGWMAPGRGVPPPSC